MNKEGGITYVLCTRGTGANLRNGIINKTLTPKEGVALTVSKIHDIPHRDMAKQRVRHTQGFRDGSLLPQFLVGVYSGHPGVLIRGGLYGQAR